MSLTDPAFGGEILQAIGSQASSIASLVESSKDLRQELKEVRQEMREVRQEMSTALGTCKKFEECKDEHADLPRRVSALENKERIATVAIGLLWSIFLLFVTLVGAGLIRLGS